MSSPGGFCDLYTPVPYTAEDEARLSLGAARAILKNEFKRLELCRR